MHSTPIPLAALLSVLMISSSVSASACDLACWLHQANSDCHDGGSPTPEVEADMSMSLGMVMHMDRDKSQRMEGTPVRTGRAPEDSIAMSADMDMGADGGDSSEALDTTINATTGYLVLMSPQPDIATERLVRGARPGMEKRAIPDHSRTVSSCTHETCNQISASTSPPNAPHSQHDALNIVASSASSLLNLWTDSDWIRPGPTPPENATMDQLATILRI